MSAVETVGLSSREDVPSRQQNYRNGARCRRPFATPTAIYRGRRRSLLAGQPAELTVGADASYFWYFLQKKIIFDT